MLTETSAKKPQAFYQALQTDDRISLLNSF